MSTPETLLLVNLKNEQKSKRFQIMRIAKDIVQKLFIWIWVSYNSNIFVKHLRSVANKLIEIKKLPENLFISRRGTQKINWTSQPTSELFTMILCDPNFAVS